MPQVPKKELRERILAAALEVFAASLNIPAEHEIRQAIETFGAYQIAGLRGLSEHLGQP